MNCIKLQNTAYISCDKLPQQDIYENYIKNEMFKS